jgi:hypothetical protein
MSIRVNSRVVVRAAWDEQVHGQVSRVLLDRVIVQPDGGRELITALDEDVREERLTEYLFARKEGFGRTPWPRFIALQAASLFFLGLSLCWLQEAWPVALIVLLSEGAWAFGTYRNFKGLSA